MKPAAATPLYTRAQLSNLTLALGGLVLALLWFGPLPAMAHSAFSPHMLLHLGIVVIAAPLLAFSLAARLPPLTGFGNALSWSLLAGLFEMVAVWSWHIPILHNAAGANPGLFALEQMSFLLGGLAVWAASFAATDRPALAAAAIALFLTFTHMTMFGMMLTLAPKLLYDPHICRGAFGFDPLADQHFGGVLMAVGGGLAYFGGAIWAISRAWFAIAYRKIV